MLHEGTGAPYTVIDIVWVNAFTGVFIPIAYKAIFGFMSGSIARSSIKSQATNGLFRIYDQWYKDKYCKMDLNISLFYNSLRSFAARFMLLRSSALPLLVTTAKDIGFSYLVVFARFRPAWL